MTEDWQASLDNREAVSAVAIDLSKAFDSVCHGLLLANLRAYGFSDDAVELMTAYITWRRQRVKIENAHSEWTTLKRGVPQASLLGPLLFNIYINDLNHHISISSLRLYADDTSQYAGDTSPLVLEYIINYDLRLFSTWCENNYLHINGAKTQAIVLGPSSYNYTFKLEKADMQVCDSLKLLGVTLDRSLRSGRTSQTAEKGMRQGIYTAKIVEVHTPGCNGSSIQSLHPSPFRILRATVHGDRKSWSKEDGGKNYYILRTILGLSLTYDFILKQYAGIRSLEDTFSHWLWFVNVWTSRVQPT